MRERIGAWWSDLIKAHFGTVQTPTWALVVSSLPPLCLVWNTLLLTVRGEVIGLDIFCCLPVWPIAILTSLYYFCSSFREASSKERWLLFNLIVFNVLAIALTGNLTRPAD